MPKLLDYKNKQMGFTKENIPNQKGKIIIVTGANAGLGYETTLALAEKEATVIMACRSASKANAAKAKIVKAVPNADLYILPIDLTDLDSVRDFAKTFLTTFPKLDVLINNAGVMVPPYTKTKDGFELQMGANYFGHFLLTGLLLERLNKTPNSRVVSLSSLAHIQGSINFEDIHWEQSYSKMVAYRQSKLACLMFALELQKRLDQSNSSIISVAAHPGISPTELARHLSTIMYYAMLPLVSFISHSPSKGALPTLLAATKEGVKGGAYFGPTGYRAMKGPAGKARIARRANNEEVAQKLWTVSEDLTGINYTF